MGHITFKNQKPEGMNTRYSVSPLHLLSLGLSFLCLGMVLSTIRMDFPTSINNLLKLIVNTAIMPCNATGGTGHHWVRKKPGASASCILSRGHDGEPGGKEASPILFTRLQS